MTFLTGKTAKFSSERERQVDAPVITGVFLAYSIRKALGGAPLC